MNRFRSVRQAGQWMLVTGVLLALGGTAQAQRFPGIVGRPLPVLQQVFPADLTVVVNSRTCNQLTFTATLSPASDASPGTQLPVKVRVFDMISNVPTVVGEVLFMVPATGGSVSTTIAWPTPADAIFQPDFTNLITIMVDPDNQVTERNELNNALSVHGTCVG